MFPSVSGAPKSFSEPGKLPVLPYIPSASIQMPCDNLSYGIKSDDQCGGVVLQGINNLVRDKILACEPLVMEFTHFQLVGLDTSRVSEIISCKISFPFSSHSHLDANFITSRVISFASETGDLVQMDFQYLRNLILKNAVSEILGYMWRC